LSYSGLKAGTSSLRGLRSGDARKWPSVSMQ
jgi:hypothetical protein